MSKFKKGDLVRHINSMHPERVGSISVVEDVKNTYVIVRLLIKTYSADRDVADVIHSYLEKIE